LPFDHVPDGIAANKLDLIDPSKAKPLLASHRQQVARTDRQARKKQPAGVLKRVEIKRRLFHGSTYSFRATPESYSIPSRLLKKRRM
jgi:hypothetical protein